MGFTTRADDGVLVVTITGKLDTVTVVEFDRQVQQWIGEGWQAFVLDVGGLEYVTSAGLRSLLTIAKHARAAGGGVALSGVQPRVREILGIAGLLSILPGYPSMADAMRALARG